MKRCEDPEHVGRALWLVVVDDLIVLIVNLVDPELAWLRDQSVVEPERVADFVDGSAEDIGLVQCADFLPAIGVVELDVAAIVRAGREIRLGLGDGPADGSGSGPLM